MPSASKCSCWLAVAVRGIDDEGALRVRRGLDMHFAREQAQAAQLEAVVHVERARSAQPGPRGVGQGDLADLSGGGAVVGGPGQQFPAQRRVAPAGQAQQSQHAA